MRVIEGDTGLANERASGVVPGEEIPPG